MANATPDTNMGLRHRISRLWHGVRSSIAVRCLACILVYAALLALILWGINRATEQLFDNAFPSMETVLAYSDDLERDRFDALQSSDLENCRIVIFDSEGTRLYASNAKAAESIRVSDLALISEYDERIFYEVFQETTVDGVHYRIMQCTYDVDDGFSKRITAWCELDEELNIIAGTLFADRSALSQREFNFLQGVYNAKMSVERVSYQTVEGEDRILVLAAPLVSGRRYQQVVDDASRLPLIAAPAAFIFTVACAWYLVRIVKRATLPLDQAIEAYRRGEKHPEAAATVPLELSPIYANFTDLMDELDRARDDQQRIIADISHDLKTPLTVIYGYATAFRDGRVPPDKAPEYLRAMSDKAITANELIDTLFAYAKMNHPEFAPHLERRRVDDAVRAIAMDAMDQVEQAACTLEVVEPDGSEDAPAPYALIDASLLRRLLLNLIGNACTHNPEGTTVYVSWRVDEGEGRVIVSVADTGAGIVPEVADRLFDPFVTKNTARTAKGGTGLGLAISQRCAELMHGQLRLSTHPPLPCATEFIIELPLA